MARERATAAPGSNRAVLVLLATAALLLIAPSARAPAHSSAPSCFGAAARDPLHPCSNPKLALAVIPSPGEAQITPNAFCAPLELSPNVCGFGFPRARARATIALLGNSHASHWRAALAPVASALRWQGLSMTRSSCPFVKATIDLSEPARARCTAWHRDIVRWFDRHPEVSVVFVSDQPTTPLVARGQSVVSTDVNGYINAWHSLPATVKHIIVIRDNPYAKGDTLPCVEAAAAHRESADANCAIPRGESLKLDPAVLAAEHLHSPRVEIVDLTRFFCDSEYCYPVIGGALVYKDEDHLTRSFAATLAPYLLAEIRHLMASWG
jgi:hypothetical protein